MKILVSDYDNTFHIKDCDMEENVSKTLEFMKDNIFVIATGRCYESYKSQENLFNIKTDYLVINHGATILKNDEVIFNKTIDNDLKNELISDLKLDLADNIYCYKEKRKVDIHEDDITKILVEYTDESDAIEIRKLIKDKYGDKLNNFQFRHYNSVEIVAGSVDKAYAVDIIKERENINDIYVIGDNHNDYLMIKNYDGYCTEVAVKEVKEIAKKEYKNVSDLICEII